MNVFTILRTASLRAIVLAGVVAFVASTTGCSQNCCQKCGGTQAAAKCGGKCGGKCADCKAAKCDGKCGGKCPKCKAAKTSALNTKCPISGEPVDPAVTTVTGGKTVAFCCGGCIGKWKKMSAEEQSRVLAAAK